MNWCRWVGMWAAGLFWLTAGVGCSNVVESDAKWGEVESVAKPESNFEMDSAAKPQAGETETIVIPLNQIWAWQMPGTRDVRELENGLKSPGELISGLRTTLSYQAENETANPGFVVEGVGSEALHEAHSVLTGERNPTARYSSEEELSIVFFSHEYGYYIHIREVVKSHNTVTISYRPVPHETKELTRHFALIPIGRNASGEFKVQIVRMPMEQRFVDAGFKEDTTKWESRVVCASFDFEILETKSD